MSMSRSEEILRKLQGSLPQPQPSQEYYEEEEVDEHQSPQLSEYDRMQLQAQRELNKEISAIESTNPHNMYTEVVSKPVPRGVCKMRIQGRPIDLAALEHFVVFKMSPRTIVTSMRYNDVRTTEDTLNYSRKQLLRSGKKGGFGTIILIIMIIIMLVAGIFMLTSGGDLTGMFQGFAI